MNYKSIEAFTNSQEYTVKLVNLFNNNIILLVALVGILILYSYNSSYIADGDQYVYLVAARGILDGKILYATTWQDKPPVAILTYLLSQIISRTSPYSIGLSLGFILVIQFLTALYFTKQFTHFSSFLRLILFIFIFITPLIDYSYLSLSIEHISNVFILIILLFSFNVAENRINLYTAIGAGIAIGLGFNTRQTVVIYALLPFVTILVSENITINKKINYYLFIFLGIILSFIFTSIFLYLYGDFKGYFYTVFTYPRLYSKTSTNFGLIDFIGNKFVLLVCLLTFLSIFTKYWYICLLSLILGTICYFLPSKGYSHYIANLIPVACLQAIVLMRRRNESNITNYRILSFISLYLIAFACYIVFTVKFSRNFSPYRVQTFSPLIDTINRKYINKNSIFIFGKPVIAAYLNYAIDIKPANTYFYCMQLDPYWSTILPKKIEDILKEYVTAPPHIMLVSWDEVNVGPNDNAHKLVLKLLQVHHYVPKETFGKWQIYELKNFSQEAAFSSL